MIERARKRLRKKARRGFRGYPVATLAFYGPDDTRATKLAVSIVPAQDVEVTDLRRWFSEESDIRNDTALRRKYLPLSTRPEPRRSPWLTELSAVHTRKASITRGPPVPHARSGLGGIAGPASS